VGAAELLCHNRPSPRHIRGWSSRDPLNRVFKDKPGGLVVDYLGLADELRRALATYTESGGTGETAIPQEGTVALMLEKYEICGALFHGFDWILATTGTAQERLSLLKEAQEHILAQENGKARLLQAVTELSHAFALAVPHEHALRIRDDVGFFQAVRAALVKSAPDDRRTGDEIDHAIRQIISKALASAEVVDIFATAGLKKPDISILSDEFLAEIRGMPQRNLAVELLQKLLSGEIRTRSRRNVVQARSFTELLEQSLRKYRNRAIETAQVIEELIALAKEMRQANARGDELELSEEELAFYDALEVNDSAVKVLGEPTLTTIARELVATVRKKTSPLTGRSATTSAPTSGSSSNASCGSTDIRRISRSARRRLCWSRPKFSRKSGQRHDLTCDRRGVAGVEPHR
jgi:type I restriction enzyme, R subunit